MGKYILVVGLNCSDPARKAEFNKWYNEIHLPDVLEIAGFKKATRWQHISPGETDAEFLALYEIESDNIGETMKVLEETIAQKSKEGRMLDLGDRVLTGVYNKLYELE